MTPIADNVSDIRASLDETQRELAPAIVSAPTAPVCMICGPGGTHMGPAGIIVCSTCLLPAGSFRVIAF